MTEPRLIAAIRGVKIWRNPDDYVSFTAGLQVDGDGSPRCYGPNGGLDFLANAGSPGNWWALACDEHGHPYVQGPNDPAPGYYVSTTALELPEYPKRDPRRYVDSETVPYIVLPSNWRAITGVKCELGSKWTVRNVTNGKEVQAIFADVGPRNQLGEGSIALAKALGVPHSPKNGGCASGITYRFHAD